QKEKDKLTTYIKQMELDRDDIVPKHVIRLEKEVKAAEQKAIQAVKSNADEKTKAAGIEKLNKLKKQLVDAKFFMQNCQTDIKQKKLQLTSRDIQMKFRQAIWNVFLEHKTDFSMAMPWDRYQVEPDGFIGLHFPNCMYPEQMTFRKRYDDKASHEELIAEMVHDTKNWIGTVLQARKEKGYAFSLATYAISHFTSDRQFFYEMDVVMGHMGPMRSSSSSSSSSAVDQKKN